MKTIIVKIKENQRVVEAKAECIIYFLEQNKIFVSETTKTLLTTDLLLVGNSGNFGGAVYRAIGNNSGNPTLKIEPFNKEVYSVLFNKRKNALIKSLEKTYEEVSSAKVSNKISAYKDKFFDKICGNGWMFGTHDVFKLDNNGKLIK